MKKSRVTPARRQHGHRRAADSAAPTPSRWVTYGPWIALAITIALVAAVRFRIADVPLERDEGEYAYAGQLILQGVAPYEFVYNMKFPGTYYAYALILFAFGQTAWGIHVGLLVVHTVTTVLVFGLGRRWIGPMPAVMAAAVFATLAIDRWIMGVFAHATHFVLPPVLAAFLVLSHRSTVSARRCAVAGAFIGVAVLMKQHAFAFLPAAMAWVWWRQGGLRSVGALSLGAVVPFGLLCLVLATQGVLGRFWFWTFQYAPQYASQLSVADAWLAFRTSWTEITQATLLLWVLAGAGAVVLWTRRWPAETRAFFAIMSLGSAAAVLPGFYFRQHYFILLLPVIGLLAGVACAALSRGLGRVFSAQAGTAIAAAIGVAPIGAYVVSEQDYLFRMSPRAISRSVYGVNPFVEAPEVADYIRGHTSASDRIAVVGSEPEIYFHAGRRSVTGYIYTYPLMEAHAYASQMQDEMMREIEAGHPAYLVGVFVPSSWLPRPASDRRILSWFSRYAGACYDPVGIVDIESPVTTTIRWEAQAAGYRPKSENLVFVYRRRSSAPCAVPR